MFGLWLAGNIVALPDGSTPCSPACAFDQHPGLLAHIILLTLRSAAGNIFALPDGRIAYVDFGNVAELSQRNKEVRLFYQSDLM